MEIVSKPTLLYFVIGYIVAIVLMGIYYSKKIESSEDFILAGRTLGPIILMGTMLATWCGSGTVTGGYNSLAYSFGLGPAMFFGLPSLIGVIFLFTIAEKIRGLNKHTIPEILEINYGTYARGLATIIVFLSYVGIIAYQYQGLGFILNVTTGLPVDIGTIVGAVIMIVLATMGGLMSVAPTDALSALIIVTGLILGVPAMFSVAGGWSNIVAKLPPDHLKLTGNLTGIQMLGYLIPTLSLILADQNMYQRITAAKGGKEAKIGVAGWLLGMIIINFTIPFISLTARALFPDIQAGMALIASTLVMPTIVGGLLIAAIAAFIITTGDSFLLSAATNITFDFYGKYINPNLTDAQKLIITKWLIPVIGVISYTLIKFFPTVLELQMYAYTVYGAGLTPAVLGTILWRRVNKYGGLASMIVGVVATLIWEIPLSKPMGINSAVISVPLAVITLIVVTLLTSKKETAVIGKNI